MSNKMKLFAAFFSIFFFISAARSFSDDVKPPFLNTKALIVSCRALLLEKDAFVIYDPKVQSICFNGQINKASATQAAEMLESKSVKTLVISSSGGSVHYALDMAEYIQAKKIDIVVNHYCVSSCANYLFLAARYKYVTQGSFVGWHGGPEKNLKKIRKDIKRLWKKKLKKVPKTVFTENLNTSIKFIKNDLARQDKLLALAGVSEDLLYINRTREQNAYLVGLLAKHKQSPIFVPSPEDLARHYGVKGLVDVWHPGNQTALEHYVEMQKNEVKNDKGWFVFDVYLYTFPPDSW
jgi:ATP-dependent protease ClpP protease subunit